MLPSAAVRSAMGHARVQVRRAACIALRDPEHRDCHRDLASLAENDPEMLVRVAAIRAMGRAPHPDHVAVLQRLFDTSSWLEQSHVLPALLAHGDAGLRALERVQASSRRSGAIRWIREFADGQSSSS
jgi:HEAT repeat protein